MAFESHGTNQSELIHARRLLSGFLYCPLTAIKKSPADMHIPPHVDQQNLSEEAVRRKGGGGGPRELGMG